MSSPAIATTDKIKEKEKQVWNEEDHIAIPQDENDNENRKGVIYVGHLPYGFFEEQIKEYFSQFGEITRLRLSRNKTSGKSKHYAFIEFSDEDVADIVADTMDGYLLYNHILSCKRMQPEKIHPTIWKGKYTGARKGLHNKPKLRKSIEKRKIEKLNKPKSNKEIKGVRASLIKRELAKRKKLQELGINYDFPGFVALATPEEQKKFNITKEEEKKEKEKPKKRTTPKRKKRRSSK